MKVRWTELKKRYWPPKKDQLLILVLLGLLLAVAAVPVEEKGRKREKTENSETSQELSEVSADYESSMEQKLEELLSRVEGVGQVQVMLTFEGGREKKVEKDHTTTAEESREETVYEEYGSERTPYVTLETNPKVEGVLVIAQGGKDSRVKQEILEAAQALFGIEAHKIKIMKMEESK